MIAWLRHPLLHFIAAGAVLLVASRMLEPVLYALETPTIRVTAADTYQLRQQWQREAGRPPSPAQLRALVEQHIDDAILLEEALRRDLHANDPVVRDRLLRNMRFVSGSEQVSDDALLRDAHAMGMLERDPVVRRRLIQRMRHRLESQATVDAQAVIDVAAEAYAKGAPTHYDLQQVFFSADQRPSPFADAEQALPRVRATVGAQDLGDTFLLGLEVSGQTTAELARRFGEGFSSAVANASIGEWHGPVPSPYGAHLIRVQAAVSPPLPQGPTVRQAVLQARQAAEKQALGAALTELRQRYRIVRVQDAVDTAMRP